MNINSNSNTIPLEPAPGLPENNANLFQIPFRPANTNSQINQQEDKNAINQNAGQDIATPKRSKTKIILTTLIAFLLLGSVAGAVYLVKHNQDIRKQALTCTPGEQINTCTTTCPEGTTGTCGGHTYCVWDPNGNKESECQCETAAQTCISSTPGGGCDQAGASCTVDDTCCSKVCSFGKCAANCSSFKESECFTHANCHWENGSCKDGATPNPGSGNCKISCGADEQGVSVTVQPGSEQDCAGAVVTANYFTRSCDSQSGGCAGSSTTETGSLPFSRNRTGPSCGSWQSDITASTSKGGACKAADHGLLPCGTPTPTPTTAISCQCNFIKAYSPTWQLLNSSDLSALKPGDKIRLAASGTASSGSIDKARFKINNGSWQETATKKSGSNEFYIEYTIPSGVTSFTIEAQVHHNMLGQWF